MGLIHADLCRNCGERRTKHPTGLCSQCRRTKSASTCVICGKSRTVSPDGICHHCRNSQPSIPPDQIAFEEALALARQMEFIIENRMNGVSYGQIGDMLGMPRNTVYYKFNRFISFLGMRKRTQNILLADEDKEEEGIDHHPGAAGS